jgi:hypothetical protein
MDLGPLAHACWQVRHPKNREHHSVKYRSTRLKLVVMHIGHDQADHEKEREQHAQRQGRFFDK